MAAQNLWFYRDTLFRVVEESMEVSLTICNSEMAEFTVAKLFDMFTQILPTGFVLNTGYWPLYNTLKKQSLCICSRYGIDCRHFKHDHHWLDLESLSSDNTTAFSTRYGQLILINYETEVTPVTGGTAGYLINLKLSFQYKKTERGRPRRRRDESLNARDQIIHAAIFSRYTIQREYYPAFHTIMFQPSPFFSDSYGSHIPRLLNTRPIYNNLSPEINQRFYTVSVEHMPHFSLMLHHVNLPTFTFIRNIHAIRSHVEPVRVRKTTTNKVTQTEEQENITEVWRYKEIIGNLKPLWGNSRASSYESLYSNAQAVNLGSFFNQHSAHQPNQCMLQEEHDPCPNALTESILQGVDSCDIVDAVQIKSEPVELPSSTTDDKFYDVQWPKWGFQKALNKRRGRKKELYRDVLVGAQKKIKPFNFNFPQIKTNVAPFTDNNNNNLAAPQNMPFPSYATIVKSTKTEPDVFKYTAETQVRVYETYKDDPGFQWFEQQCPGAEKPALLSQEEINENFTIAEESIRSDLERERNRNDKKRI